MYDQTQYVCLASRDKQILLTNEMNESIPPFWIERLFITGSLKKRREFVLK